jgi:hypothetical protein
MEMRDDPTTDRHRSPFRKGGDDPQVDLRGMLPDGQG